MTPLWFVEPSAFFQLQHTQNLILNLQNDFLHPDGAAARGLASAYASLAVGARRHIIEAIVADATAEGISGSSAFVALLSAVTVAADLESGLQVGDSAGFFLVKDCTGPSAGESLCYR